jgi:hypothetical protein
MPGLSGDEALRKRLRAIKDTRQLLGQVALLGVSEAKHIARRDLTKTANLERSIRLGTVTEKSAQVIAGGTSNVGYARYVEEGTGLYGPKKRRIVPRRARVLSWVGGGSRLTGKGAGSRRIFAMSVSGRKPTPYLVPGVRIAVKKAGVDVIVEVWNKAA